MSACFGQSVPPSWQDDLPREEQDSLRFLLLRGRAGAASPRVDQHHRGDVFVAEWDRYIMI